MAFIDGVCKNCGAPIKFDDSLSKGICEYCGTEFVKQDLIVNNNYYNKFENATVIINDSSIDSKLESAETYLTKLNDYSKAKKIFEFVCENKSGDYRGWWGMVRVLTKQFTLIECTPSDYDKIAKYYKNSIAVASEEQRKVLSFQWIPYIEKVENYMENEKKKNVRNSINKRIRSTISITLSLICNIYVMSFTFLNGMEEYASSWNDLFITILIIFGANIIITTILGLIGSTKMCSVFSATSAAVFLGNFIFQSFKGITFGIIEILFFAIVLTISLAIVAVCYIIPAFILHKFAHDK